MSNPKGENHCFTTALRPLEENITFFTTRIKGITHQLGLHIMGNLVEDQKGGFSNGL